MTLMVAARLEPLCNGVHIRPTLVQRSNSCDVYLNGGSVFVVNCILLYVVTYSSGIITNGRLIQVKTSRA